MKKLLSFLSVVFGWLIWRWTGSILIGALVAVILFPLIGPIIEALFGLIVLLIKELILLFVPAQEVRIATPREAGTDGKGLRVLLGTKNFSGKRPTQPTLPDSAASILTAAEHTLGGNKNFAYLSAYVGEHSLPVEVFTASYRGGLHFDKAIKAWRAATDIKLFKKQVGGVNTFSCALKAEDGKMEYAQAVFLFDDGIELPKEPEQAPVVKELGAEPNP